MIRCLAALWCCALVGFLPLTAQQVENTRISGMVQQFKSDPKGPYKDIRWFCKDGSTVPGTERCSEPGGVQRARYKDEVVSLGRTNHLFLGQILSTTTFPDIWDTSFNHSRLKQYQVEKYLQINDNGWILRKARFYRGAYQAEDEEVWGAGFLTWLLAQDESLKRNFFLIREAVRVIPHAENDNKAQKIRALSKEVSDSVQSFMNIRVKIHGQPDASDIQRVESYLVSHRKSLKPAMLNKLDLLLSEMRSYYTPPDLLSLTKYLTGLPKNSELYRFLALSLAKVGELEPGADRNASLADMLWSIRKEIGDEALKNVRLPLMDLSVALEDMLFREAASWNPGTLATLMQKVSVLSRAAAGCGYLEVWEWESVSQRVTIPDGEAVTVHQLSGYIESARRIVEWSVAMFRSTYKTEIDLYLGFEPMATGFLDDRTRSSLLLPIGQSVGALATFYSSVSGTMNLLMGTPGGARVRGLNPGFAMGELVVVDGPEDNPDVSADKIYIFNHPPADLKPVAGIATVSEGNLVSHVQLLARNLGIPNAVLAPEDLESLKRFNGQRIFYAVSPQRTVLMKPEHEMTETELQLFETRKRSEEKILVPVERMDLAETSILNLRDVQADKSGRVCGPKAANLGELKGMFPGNVVEGLVIPFGIFRQHMDLPMPGEDTSFWGFLNQTFREAALMQQTGERHRDVDAFVFRRLEELRSAIRSITLLPGFVASLRQNFQEVFHQPLGSVPVFLRSDTNMEDLKDFTGAGLNLTLFNVLSEEKILQGIKDVWASPYSERSYTWRQRYLLNPENVYPSILIIPSVNVDYSGVMITKGIETDNAEDLTVAFSRGVGGAVEGQEAESYLLSGTGENILLSPAREMTFTTLPINGGIAKRTATFDEPILSPENISQLRLTAAEIRQRLSPPDTTENQEVYDIELGYKDNRLWLFQIRPFVENKQALSSAYLNSLTPVITDFRIPLSEPLNIPYHEN